MSEVRTEVRKEATLAAPRDASISPYIYPGISQSGYVAIRNLICNYYDVDPTELLSKNRAKSVTWPRQVMMYLCYMHIDGQTLNEIGFRCGMRDHATVLHAKRKVLNESDIYKDVYEEIHELELKVLEMKKTFIENHKPKEGA